MLTSSAWITFITANNSHRPKYACRTVNPSTSSVSTSNLNNTISTKPAIHSDRLVNNGAIDDPYAGTGNRSFSCTCTGPDMNPAIESGSSDVSRLTWSQMSAALIAPRSVCRVSRSDCTSARLPSSELRAVPVSPSSDSSSPSMSTASPTSTRCESSADENAPTLEDSDAMDWLSPGRVPDIMPWRAADDLATAFIASVAASV